MHNLSGFSRPQNFHSSARPPSLRTPVLRNFDGAFFGIPGNCTIKIYDELGRLIATPDSDEPGLKNNLRHSDGSGDAYWNCVTTYGQIVVSGIYIAVVTNNDTGAKQIVKFVVIR